MRPKSRSLGRPRQNQTTKPTKTIILDTATKLFIQHGYKIVSMDDVAKECDITKASVYYYYSSKADLFTDAMVHMMQRIALSISQILATDAPLKARLYQLVKIQLSATIDVDMGSFMRDAKTHLSDQQLQMMKESEEQMYKAMENVLIEAMNKGEMPKFDPKFATHSFMSLLNVGNYRDAESQPIFPSIDEATKQIVDFYLRGLGVQ
ncbi:TetR/AcrR family transcriptional regulator [Viridibacillus sp. NPDC093762]|uniref:TetR/AcrR family transcriptional regulator n=1 Tax=Viridibacillus sp. NPDC093762 TaxID=3390720 RepID=UPI003D06B49E